MNPRTKISLIVVTLIAAAGLFYAATPTFFTSAPSPTGVAASSAKMYVTEYCNPEIDTISDTGMVTPFATLPGNPGECKERYIAISPDLGIWAPNDIYVTDGGVVYKVTPDGLGVTTFTTIEGCGNDHSGITFDHVGTFGLEMIVTCESGDVWRIDSSGTPKLVANLDLGDAEYEGPAVVPVNFGPLGGQILVADEDHGAVHAINNLGHVTLGVFSHFNAEAVLVVPSVPCTLGSSDAVLVSALQQQNQLVKLSMNDFTGMGGDILIMSEEGQGILREHWNGSGYEESPLDTTSLPYEGSAFLDCGGAPPASPTPTPTATATAQPSPTPTPTPTATPCTGLCQISSSIPFNFNNTVISGGNYLWFTAVLKPSGLGSNPVTFCLTNQTIKCANFTVPVPDATVTFDPTVTFATTTFSDGKWVTVAPSSGLPGNTFFSGLGYQVPATLPAGIKNVTWSGTISPSTPGVSIQWKWAAGVFTNFNPDYNALGVKAVDGTGHNQYPNSDHAGTPENYKSFVVQGATGGGASNYTGSLSGTAKVGPCR